MAVGQFSADARYYRTKWTGTTEWQKTAVNRRILTRRRARPVLPEFPPVLPEGARSVLPELFPVLPRKIFPESVPFWRSPVPGSVPIPVLPSELGTIGPFHLVLPEPGNVNQTEYFSGNGMVVVCIFGFCKTCRQD